MTDYFYKNLHDPADQQPASYFGACLSNNMGLDPANFSENSRLCVILIKNVL